MLLPGDPQANGGAKDGWKDVLSLRAPVRLGSEVFVSGRRVYRAIAVNPPGDRADRDAQRFIDSFRFETSKP